MSEPNLTEVSAALACVPTDRPRVQRYQIVQRVSVTQQPSGPVPSYIWLSHHRSLESAATTFATLLPGDRAEARIFDLRRGEFCESPEWSKERGRALGDALSRHLASGGGSK